MGNRLGLEEGWDRVYVMGANGRKLRGVEHGLEK